MTDEEVRARVNHFFSQYQSCVYKKGETILRPDKSVSSIYYVLSGFVRLYSILNDSRELTLNIFRAGTYFPMFLVLGQTPNSYYYQTLTPVRLQKAPKEAVLRFIKKEPEVLFEVTKRIAIGLNGLLTNIQYLLLGSAYSRVCATLLLLSKRFGEKLTDGQSIIKLPLTHQDIANLVGITRETTSLEMGKLSSRGLISYRHKRVIIKDSEGLEKEVFIEGTAQTAAYDL